METKIANIEEDTDFNHSLQCIHCKCLLNGKPWLSVNYEEKIYNACKYNCGVKMHLYVGTTYWEKVINKEDFNEPRPVFQVRNITDITTGFDMEQIRYEIAKEDERIRLIEENYENESSNSDEEYFE